MLTAKAEANQPAPVAGAPATPGEEIGDLAEIGRWQCDFRLVRTLTCGGESVEVILPEITDTEYALQQMLGDAYDPTADVDDICKLPHEIFHDVAGLPTWVKTYPLMFGLAFCRVEPGFCDRYALIAISAKEVAGRPLRWLPFDIYKHGQEISYITKIRPQTIMNLERFSRRTDHPAYKLASPKRLKILGYR